MLFERDWVWLPKCFRLFKFVLKDIVPDYGTIAYRDLTVQFRSQIWQNCRRHLNTDKLVRWMASAPDWLLNSCSCMQRSLHWQLDALLIWGIWWIQRKGIRKNSQKCPTTNVSTQEYGPVLENVSNWEDGLAEHIAKSACNVYARNCKKILPGGEFRKIFHHWILNYRHLLHGTYCRTGAGLHVGILHGRTGNTNSLK